MKTIILRKFLGIQKSRWLRAALWLCAIKVAFLLGPHSALAATFEVIAALENPAQEVFGISSDGNVIHGQTSKRFSRSDAGGFRWSQQDGLQICDAPPGAPISQGRSTVGRLFASSATGTILAGDAGILDYKVPTVWTAGEGLVELPNYFGGSVRAASADGSILVGKEGTEAAKWVNRELFKLPLPFTREYSFAMDVSSDGTKILGAIDTTNRGTYDALVLWENGVPTIIHRGSDVQHSLISDDGETVAVTFKANAAFPPTYKLLLLKGDGSRQLTATYGQFSQLIPIAIAPDGSCGIGSASHGVVTPTGELKGSKAVLWKKSGAVRSLLDILIWDHNLAPFDEDGVPLIEEAPALAKVGEELIIMGTARLLTHVFRAVILDPNQGPPLEVAGGSMLDDGAGFRAKVRLREVYSETLPSPWTLESVVRKNSFSATIVASMAGIDFSQIGPETQVSVRIGDFSHTAFLGEDSKFNAQRSKASFPLTVIENGEAKGVGLVTYRWNARQLTITVSAKNQKPFSLAFKRHVRWKGPIEGHIPVQVGFGSASGKRNAIYLKGASNVQQKGPSFPTVYLHPVMISGSERNTGG